VDELDRGCPDWTRLDDGRDGWRIVLIAAVDLVRDAA